MSPATQLPDSDSTPRVLFLKSGDVLLVRSSGNDLICSLVGADAPVRLSGRFSAALSALLAGGVDRHDAAILEQLGRQYASLRGLQQAVSWPADGFSALLGQGLGLLFVELTSRCNERCTHCYAEAGPERRETLSFQIIRDILTQAMALGSPTLQFTGGDPLLHPQLVHAVALARELGYADIEIYTNGLLLSQRLLARLAAYAPRFAFSLYAHTADLHDRITCVPGSHARTTAAIRRAQAAGLDVRVGITLMPENIAYAEDVRRFAENALGLSPAKVHVAHVKAVGRGLSGSVRQGTQRIGRSGKPRRGASHAGMRQRRGKLCVAADGSVYPCIFARHTCLGNVHDLGLVDIVRQLDCRRPAAPSVARWRHCLQSLSCQDCQAIAYALGEGVEDAVA